MMDLSEENSHNRADLLRAFNSFDLDSDGFLDVLEFKAACSALGISKIDDLKVGALSRSCTDIGTSPRLQQAKTVFSFSQFVDVCSSSQWESTDEKEELQEIFKLLDRERKARIVDSSLSDADTVLMVREADRSGRGGIYFEDFELIFLRVHGHKSNRYIRGIPGASTENHASTLSAATSVTGTQGTVSRTALSTLDAGGNAVVFSSQLLEKQRHFNSVEDANIRRDQVSGAPVWRNTLSLRLHKVDDEDETEEELL